MHPCTSSNHSLLIDLKTGLVIGSIFGPQRSAIAVKLLELTADEPLSDLFRAATDVVELGIAPVSTRWVLIDVAVASQELDALVGDSHRAARVI